MGDKAFEPIGHNSFFVGTVKNDFDTLYLIYKIGGKFLYLSNKYCIVSNSILSNTKLNSLYSYPYFKIKINGIDFYFSVDDFIIADDEDTNFINCSRFLNKRGVKNEKEWRKSF